MHGPQVGECSRNCRTAQAIRESMQRSALALILKLCLGAAQLPSCAGDVRALYQGYPSLPAIEILPA